MAELIEVVADRVEEVELTWWDGGKSLGRAGEGKELAGLAGGKSLGRAGGEKELAGLAECGSVEGVIKVGSRTDMVGWGWGGRVWDEGVKCGRSSEDWLGKEKKRN